MLAMNLRKIRTEADAAAYLEAWNRHDPAGILDFHTPDTIFTSAAFGRRAAGRLEVLQSLETVFTVWPDLKLSRRRQHLSATLMVFEGILEGTLMHPLPLDGEVLQPSGRKVAFEVVDIFTLEDGSIREKITYIDKLSYRRQMLGDEAAARAAE